MFDPVTVDEAGAPYLRYVNHKLSREAVIPISERLLAQSRTQHHDLVERYGRAPAVLLPGPRSNPDGKRPISAATITGRLDRWIAACEIRDATGQPVHVTAYQFRHTLGTRLINNGVSLDVRRLLDHNSAEMTIRYATIKDQALRREWDRFQQRVNVRGELIPDPTGSPLSDAAWAKENLGRAKQTLPNGYCGLPAGLPAPQRLPDLRQLLDHRRVPARPPRPAFPHRATHRRCRRRGHQRLVDMNEPVP